ncbi:Stress response protein SCP2 [Streptomyces sp. WMMB 714]|uniref:TerD family protein n=1 Tax=Streptomyces sp. WMMB 714 TaxID=1286822 RepID=UPI0005F857A9|nr:TerD family protein [Streptomyces sp. WMMB 714]SCK12700.1 Stress response protein SCP2 [Streptomyces sp. WMMB 714]
MAREFQRGHKAKISDLTAGRDLYVGVQIAGPGLSFDISCFGLDADERLSDDRYFIFFNQPKSPEESLQQLGAQSGDTESFRVTLDRIPSQIKRLSFTAALDGAGQMSQAQSGYIRIVAGGEEVARYSFDGSEFSTERAVMLGDFYFKDEWRFAAVGQGFDGGLDALLRNFGGEVLEEEEPAAAEPAQAPGFAPPGGASEPPGFAPPAGAPAPASAPPAASAPPQQPPAFGAPQPAAAQQGPVPGTPAHASAPTIAAPDAYAQGQAPAQPAPPGPPGPPPQQPAPTQTFSPPQAPQPPQAPFAPQAPQAPQAPFGSHAPQVPQIPQGPAAGMGVTLDKYREAPTGQRWTLQNEQLARVDLGIDGEPVLARQGSMVLYQGKVDFSYKGAGFRGRVVGNATGQEMQLMRCTGGGQVFFAEEAATLHPIELQGDSICVSADHVLAFDESLQYEVRRIEGHGIPGGALFTMVFQGTGTVVVTTQGPPVVLPVTPTTFADADAVVAWSAAAQVIVSSQVRLRRQAYPGHSGETVNLQFRGAPGNFIVVQPYEV